MADQQGISQLGHNSLDQGVVAPSRRQQRAHLRQALDAITAAAGDYVYTLDAHGRIMFASQELLALLDKTEQQVHGIHHHIALGHADDDGQPYGAEDCRLCAALRAGGTVTGGRVATGVQAATPVVHHSQRLTSCGKSPSTIVWCQTGVPRTPAAWRTHTDGLTYLPGPELFTRYVHDLLNQPRCDHKPLAVYCCMLQAVDAAGRPLGDVADDEVLIAAAGRIQALTRDSVVSRFGAAEFVVCATRVKSHPHGAAIGDRIVEAFIRPIVVGGRQAQFTVTLGMQVAGSDHCAAQLIQDARAKAHGTNRVDTAVISRDSCASGDLDPTAETPTDLHRDLRRAITRDELRLFYQPIVSLPCGDVIGMEALLRWQHPRRGLIGPDQFIPLAEATGLIVPIGAWVLETACIDAQRWRRNPALGRLRISVNVSGRQLAEPDFDDVVRRLLQRTGAHPSLLCLEITESVLMADVETTTDALHSLKGLGVQLAIDDFGTGYSSLAYLLAFPVDELKVDRSFVAGLDRNTGGWPIVSAIVGLARALGLTTVAEGVETDAQVEAVRSLGCDNGQGFRWASPRPAAYYEARTARGRPWTEIPAVPERAPQEEAADGAAPHTAVGSG